MELPASRYRPASEIEQAFEKSQIPVLVDPSWLTIARWRPEVVIDAILAKKNIGTRMDEAELVIGLGPGFCAGVDITYCC